MRQQNSTQVVNDMIAEKDSYEATWKALPETIDSAESAPAAVADTDPMALGWKDGEKLAGVFDFLKPTKHQGIGSATAAGIVNMEKEGYLDGQAKTSAPPAQAPSKGDGVDDAIMEAKRRDEAIWLNEKAGDLRRITPGKSDEWYRSEALKRLKAR